MGIIGHEVEIIGSEGTHLVTYEHGIFTVTSNQNGYILKFRLTKAPSKLTKKERIRVLEGNLSEITPEIEVSVKDMFIQAEFIEEII